MASADGFDDLDEDEDCGHLIVEIEVDGRKVDVHHTLPDDTAPHYPTSECGCSPILHQVNPGLWVYEHIDQDADEDAPPWQHS